MVNRSRPLPEGWWTCIRCNQLVKSDNHAKLVNGKMVPCK